MYIPGLIFNLSSFFPSLQLAYWHLINLKLAGWSLLSFPPFSGPSSGELRGAPGAQGGFAPE